MSELESENESKISLYITQKSEFTASLRMLIDQIDSILRRDDSQRQTVSLPALETPIYYPLGVDLWAEMPVKIIKKAAEEHEECMMSIDDARSSQQIKHRHRKVFKRDEQHTIDDIGFPKSTPIHEQRA